MGRGDRVYKYCKAMRENRPRLEDLLEKSLVLVI